VSGTGREAVATLATRALEHAALDHPRTLPACWRVQRGDGVDGMDKHW
jgi:hypothetical protein